MPSIRITVTGLDEAIRGLNASEFELQNAKNNILQQSSDFMANEMRRNAHVITGRMKNSIRNSVTGNEAIVEVPVEYAYYENRRSGSKAGYGTHNFADMARDSTIREMPNIVKREIDNIISRL